MESMLFYKISKKLIQICSIITCSFLLSTAALAAGSGSDDKKSTGAKSNYYYDAVKLINNKSYEAAVDKLFKAEKNNSNDADIYNYLGFSFRKMGNLDKAAFYYEKALTISPKHKGALEYQGEMFLTQGNLKLAEINLKKLEKICFLGCKEEKMLKESIMKYNKGQKSSY
jgi:tetratricopeptide (TPR) repeat protein